MPLELALFENVTTMLNIKTRCFVIYKIDKNDAIYRFKKNNDINTFTKSEKIVYNEGVWSQNFVTNFKRISGFNWSIKILATQWTNKTYNIKKLFRKIIKRILGRSKTEDEYVRRSSEDIYYIKKESEIGVLIKSRRLRCG